MKQLIKSALAGAMLLATSLGANALTLRVNDMANPGVEFQQSGLPFVNETGTVGGFNFAIVSGSLTSTPGSYTLDTSSIQLSGVGHLRIVLRHRNLPDLPGSGLALLGIGTVSNPADRITVKHFVKVGSNPRVQVGGTMEFPGLPGFQQASQYLAQDGKFGLRTVIDIYSTANDQVSNVNATLTAAVPAPAAGLLLLTALGGLGLARRRRKTA